jgi:hypothetical protein
MNKARSKDDKAGSCPLRRVRHSFERGGDDLVDHCTVEPGGSQ